MKTLHFYEPELVCLGLAREVLTINEAAHFAEISSWTLREQMNRSV